LAGRVVQLLGVFALAGAAAASAQAARTTTSATACIGKPYSYAGLQSESTAFGVSATLTATADPYVPSGHVGGWIGVGGTDAGPGGSSEWIQVGLSAMTSDATNRMYYEVTVAGSQPRYVQLAASVRPGEAHRFSVLEMAARPSWWRIRVDGRAVSPPIHLPGSAGNWYPQAVAENWNGGTGTCNGYGYRFSNLALARRGGGSWTPLTRRSVFQDAGYRVVGTGAPDGFVASSV
jgi:hypothetical protein